MAFAEYARRYADHLTGNGGVEHAAALAVLAQAADALPVFYCTDPYVPGYGRAGQMLTDVPYGERVWMPDLPAAGCHRVILADLVGRFFLSRGVPVRLFEADPTFCVCHVRPFESP